MRRVLLTGATGFVGRQILKCLMKRDLNIRLVVRSGWDSKLTLPCQTIEVLETSDLFSENKKWWKIAFEGVDIVIHAAWFVEPGLYLTSVKNVDCLQGTLVMAQAAREQNILRFVGLGTCVEYKSTKMTITTESEFEATTLYSACKLSLYNTLSHYFSESPVSFLWCRLFYLYGEKENTRRFAASLHKKMQQGEQVNLTSGKQIRDFMDVSDAAKRIVDLTFSDTENGANICTGEGKSIRQMAETIADIYGRRDLLNFGARSKNLIDPPCIVGEPTLPVNPK